MTETLAPLGPFLAGLVEVSLHAGVLVLLVLTAQSIFNRWLSPRGRYALWGLVVLRLLLPAVPGSPLSIWNLIPERTPELHATPANPVLTAPPTHSTPTAIPRPVSAPHVPVFPTAVPSTPSIQLNPWLLFWATGAALLLTRALWLHVRLHHRLVRDSASAIAALVWQFDRVRRLQNIRRPVRLLLTDAVSTPALVGVFRPAVLLPPHIVDGLTSDELDDVLAHELTHLRHHDVAANWLLVLLTAAYWFNPLVWLAVHRLKTDREAARDADAIATTPHRDPRGYARTLIRVMELMQPGHHPPTATGMSLSPSALKRRVQTAAQGTCRSWRSTVAAGLLAALLTACGLSPNTTSPDPSESARSQQPTTPPRVAPLRDSGVAALNERYDLSVRGVPFVDTIEYLRQQTGLQIEVDWATLEAAGLERSSPISLWLQQVEAGAFLRLVLQQVSSAMDDAFVAFATEEDGIIRITAEDAHPPLTTRTYDIRSFLGREGSAPPANLTPAVPVDDRTPDQIVKTQLAELIQKTVGQLDEWGEHGGSMSSIRQDESALVVTTSERNHAHIQRLLATFHEGQTKIESGPDPPPRSTGFSPSLDPRRATVPRAYGDLRRVREPGLNKLIHLDGYVETFGDALIAIRHQTDLNLFCNWAALQHAGVTRQTPLTLQLRDISVRDALLQLVDTASPDQAKLGVGWFDGVITISTDDDLFRSVHLRVYDVRDLVGRPESDPQRIREVIDFLRSTTGRPGEWVVDDPSVSPNASQSIRELNGNLIIHATDRVHDQVLRGLKSLRNIPPANVKIQSELYLVGTATFADLPLPALQELDDGFLQNIPSRYAVINQESADRLTRDLKSHRDVVSLLSPAVLARDDEAALVEMTAPFEHVSAVRAAPESSGYTTTVSTSAEYFRLHALALIQSRGGDLLLNLEPELAFITDIETRAAPGFEDAPEVPELKIPAFETWRCRLALELSPGQSLLLVGPKMTGKHHEDSGFNSRPSGTPWRPVLRVSATVVPIEDAIQDPGHFPGLDLDNLEGLKGGDPFEADPRPKD